MTGSGPERVLGVVVRYRMKLRKTGYHAVTSLCHCVHQRSAYGAAEIKAGEGRFGFQRGMTGLRCESVLGVMVR
jgi:hypothetical protein